MSFTLLILVYSFERGVSSFIIQHHLREVHCFVYLSQQMVFRHKVVYAGYFTLASFFLFSVQHFITLFYYGNL